MSMRMYWVYKFYARKKCSICFYHVPLGAPYSPPLCPDAKYSEDLLQRAYFLHLIHMMYSKLLFKEFQLKPCSDLCVFEWVGRNDKSYRVFASWIAIEKYAIINAVNSTPGDRSRKPPPFMYLNPCRPSDCNCLLKLWHSQRRLGSLKLGQVIQQYIYQVTKITIEYQSTHGKKLHEPRHILGGVGHVSFPQ